MTLKMQDGYNHSVYDPAAANILARHALDQYEARGRSIDAKAAHDAIVHISSVLAITKDNFVGHVRSDDGFLSSFGLLALVAFQSGNDYAGCDHETDRIEASDALVLELEAAFFAFLTCTQDHETPT